MLTVLYEPWRAHPLVWIHRGEARTVADELRTAGWAVRLERLHGDEVSGLAGRRVLLRLSDPVMLRAATLLTQRAIRYAGPSAAVIARCYDKLEATRIARTDGIECPVTAMAHDARWVDPPRILKPRRGSDSIGVRVLGHRDVPPARRNAQYIVQQQIVGTELTIAVLHGHVGTPLRIELPPGVPYSFVRKYVRRPRRFALADRALAQRCRDLAARVAAALGVDWAARIDLMHDTANDRLHFLECDVAPLISADSAFAASLAAAGVSRAEQLRLLLADD